MLVQRIATFEQLQSLQNDWDGLSGHVPFRRWDWLTTWWRHFGRGAPLFVLVARRSDGGVAGVAPWYLEHNPALGRVVRPLGAGQVCSDYLTILARPEDELEVVTAIADWLAVASRGAGDDTWDLLELDGIEGADPRVQRLAERLTDDGHQVHRRPQANCWRVPLPTDWDAYVGSLSRSVRRRVRWADKQLQDAAEFSVHHARTQEEVRAAWPMFVELHQKRRTSLGQPGCFADQTFGRFLAEVVEAFARRDGVELVWIARHAQPIAAELIFQEPTVAFVYQTGIEPTALDHNPGWLVNVAAMRRAVASGQTAFDLLRGDEPYKSQLGAEPCAAIDLRLIPNRIGPRLRHRVWLTGCSVKRWIKSSFQTAGLW